MSKQRSRKAGNKGKRGGHLQSSDKQLTLAVNELASAINRCQDDKRTELNWSKIGAHWSKLNAISAFLGVLIPIALFLLPPAHDVLHKPTDQKAARENEGVEATVRGNEQVPLSSTAQRGSTDGYSEMQLKGWKGNAPKSSASTTEYQRILLAVGDGRNVELRSTLRGMTPFIGKNHYAIVTPPNGTEWVTPLSVAVDGKLRGNPQFGEGAIGIGDSFVVRVLVTSSLLSSGKLYITPGDAVFSDAIVVTRQL